MEKGFRGLLGSVIFRWIWASTVTSSNKVQSHNFINWDNWRVVEGLVILKLLLVIEHSLEQYFLAYQLPVFL